MVNIDEHLSYLPPTLFLLFISDLLNQTSCPIHSYAYDTTLHFSMSFHRPPTLQEVHSARREASERLTSLLSKISDWGKANLLVLFNALKTQFLRLSTRHNLPNNYPLIFNDTQLSPSPTLNILGLSFTCNPNFTSPL